MSKLDHTREEHDAKQSPRCRSLCVRYLGMLLVGVASLLLTCLAEKVRADGNPLNGATRRPFYIFAHNPNTLEDVNSAFAFGANALEPDVTLATCNTGNALDDLVVWDSSFPGRNGRCSDIKFTAWLDGVHNSAFDNNLALIVFDLKSSVATPERGRIILDAIRTHLSFEAIKVNVILSVAIKDDLAVFADILKILGPREGVMVDSEDDAGGVVNYFFARGYFGNIGYGDGTAGPGPHLVTAIDGAAWLRATVGFPRSVTYVYTINLEDSMRIFIDAGVDGIITDKLSKLAGILDGRSDVRLATRQDNPFQPLSETYGLMIRSGNDGTDANITFTLEGALGSSQITVNTAPTGRMESGDVNFVTLPSRNLGALKSITVENDGSGNRPDWFLQDITVQSARWLKPDPSYHYTARLNGINRGHGSDKLAFRLDEFVWGGFAGASDGTSTKPWKRITDAHREVAPYGTIHVGSGSYFEKIILSKPCTLSFSSARGTDPVLVGSQ